MTLGKTDFGFDFVMSLGLFSLCDLFYTQERMANLSDPLPRNKVTLWGLKDGINTWKIRVGFIIEV